MVTAALLPSCKKAGRYSYFLSGNKFKRAFKSKAAAKGITIKKKAAPPPLVCWNHNEKQKKSEAMIKELIAGSIYDYECLDKINFGAYGTVYRARDRMTGEIVAVKKEADGFSKSTLVEINMLRSLKHPSIVEYKRVVADDDDDDDDVGVYVVMEYVEYDLCEYILKTPAFSLTEVKRLMRELLEGVRFLHRNRVMHRDLKPSNVLVNRKGELKICDFGMSRQFPTESDPLCSPLVCTLWYRAPELLLGSCTSYSAAVDMWSVGCIMAEFFLRRVLFRGESEIQQLRFINNTILDQPRDQLHDKFVAATSSNGGPVLTEGGFDLLCQLLAYDPQNRISAEDALDHEWFDELNFHYHVFL